MPRANFHSRRTNLMANGKTHLVVGALVGVALDGMWQCWQMKRNPDRKFDWLEMAGACAAGGIVGILPDILEPATSPNHRGFFHSFAFIAILLWAFGIFGVKLTLRATAFCAATMLCYLSHLFLDSLTPRSLPWIGRWRC